jgi:hypothetical protein
VRRSTLKSESMGAVALLSISLFCAGCVSAPTGQQFAGAPAAPEGYATVYLYRLGAIPKLRRPTVFLDDVTVYEPREGEVTWVYVRTGAHTIRVHWARSVGLPDSLLKHDFVAGKSYYSKISGSMAIHPLITGGFVGSTDSVIQLTDAATDNLTICCNYIAPARQRIEGPE